MKAYDKNGELVKIASPNPWVMLALGTAIFVILMSLFFPPDPSDFTLILVLAIIVLLVDLFILAIAYILWSAFISLNKSHSESHANRQLASNFISDSTNYLYHWKYTKRDRQWIARHTILGGFIGLLVSPFIGIILQFTTRAVMRRGVQDFPSTGNPIQDLIQFFSTAMILGGIFGLMWFINSIFQALKRLANIPDVYFGENAIYSDNQYWCWHQTPYRFSKVELSDRQLDLELVYEVQEHEKDRNFALTMRWFGDEPTGKVKRSIFIPLGQEEAANQLVQIFSKQCIPEREVVTAYESSRDDYYDYRYYNDNDKFYERNEDCPSDDDDNSDERDEGCSSDDSGNYDDSGDSFCRDD